jgi:hypothetical protein
MIIVQHGNHNNYYEFKCFNCLMDVSYIPPLKDAEFLGEYVGYNVYMYVRSKQF